MTLRVPVRGVVNVCSEDKGSREVNLVMWPVQHIGVRRRTDGATATTPVVSLP